MKVAVVARDKDLISPYLKKHSLKKNNKRPDIVIAFGGEGTFLFAEQKYPSKPKLLIYHSSSCKNCKTHDFNHILRKLKNQKFKIVKEMKLDAFIRRKKLTALNDINIHYKMPCALRFNLAIDSTLINEEIIGDGLVVSTPYGSSGYFYSIARKTFEKGIGLAFNNPVKNLKNLVLATNSVIKVKITRGPGYISVDSNKKLIPLKTSDTITIKKSRKKARLIMIDNKKKLERF